MKKLIALLLSCMMLLSVMAPALAEEYSEHMDFKANYIDYGVPAVEDDMYHYFLDRFNMDIEMVGMPQSNYGEVNTLAITGGTMPDWTQWNMNYNAYVSYVDQGLLREMPEDWETRWPNIYKMAEASGILPALYIDGKLYCIPHSINVNLREGVNMGHITMYYRADWAKQVGIEIGDSCTLDEFAAYIKAVEDAGLTKSGINGTASNLLNMIMFIYAPYWSSFRKVDGQYIWGPCGEGVIDGIKKVKQLYEDGILDPDYFMTAKTQAHDKFTSGMSATVFSDGTISNYVLLYNNAVAAGIENPHEAIDVTVITNDKGNFASYETTNFWTAMLFNPEISDERLERVLDMTDFVCSLDGELAVNMGMPDVDWKKTESGEYEILRSAAEDGSYPDIKNVYNSLYFFWFQGILPDEFSFINPTIDPVIKERVNKMYDIRCSSPDYIPLDLDYTYFASDAKANYSVDINGEINRIATDPNISMDDVEKEWNTFIENYRGIWEPVVEDLNKAFGE